MDRTNVFTSMDDIERWFIHGWNWGINTPSMDQIFPRSRKEYPRDRTDTQTNFFLPQESFTFRDHREVGRVVWQSRAFVWPSEVRLDSEAKSDSPTDRRSRKGKLSQGKESGLSVRFLPLGYTLSSTVGCIFCLIWCLFNHKS